MGECAALHYGTEPGVAGDEKGFLVDMSRCHFDPPLRIAAGESYVLRSEYGADVDNFAPAAFPPPYEGVMGYMTMYFTVAEDAEVGVFSMSGNRTSVATSEAGARGDIVKNATGTSAAAVENNGFCLVDPTTTFDAGVDPSSSPSSFSSSDATPVTVASDESGADPLLLETNGGDEKNDGRGGFIQLTPDHNFTMQWNFVDGGENVAFKLRRGRSNIRLCAQR